MANLGSDDKNPPRTAYSRGNQGLDAGDNDIINPKAASVHEVVQDAEEVAGIDGGASGEDDGVGDQSNLRKGGAVGFDNLRFRVTSSEESNRKAQTVEPRWVDMEGERPLEVEGGSFHSL